MSTGNRDIDPNRLYIVEEDIDDTDYKDVYEKWAKEGLARLESYLGKHAMFLDLHGENEIEQKRVKNDLGGLVAEQIIEYPEAA